MRLVGYCERCRKIRYVRVSAAGLALATRGVATGVCSDCERREEEERRAKGRG